jgi:hypothetical protein
LPGIPGRKPWKPTRPPSENERGLFGFLISNLFWMAVVAAMLACLVQMVRQPDNIPAGVGADNLATRETFDTLKELATSQKPISWTVNGKAINQFLETTIAMQSGDSGPSLLRARFQRAFVRLHSGSFDFCVEQGFLGIDLVLLLHLEPEDSGTGMAAKPTGAAFGRLPVHPMLIPAFVRLFEPTLEGLSRPLEILRQAKSVKITPDDATLQWPGTGKTKP